MGKELTLAIRRKNEIQATQDLRIVNAIHDEICKTSKHLLIKFVEAGRVLIRIKESLGHGHFQDWFEKADTKLAHSTARRYMRLAMHWDEIVEKHGSSAYQMSLEAALNKVAGLTESREQKASKTLTPIILNPTSEADEQSACPHGGPHEYDDEACIRCHDPRPDSAPGAAPVAAPLADAEESDCGLDDQGEGSTEDEAAGVAPQLAAKVFRELERDLIDVYRRLSKLANEYPASRYGTQAVDSLDVSIQDFRKLKKEVM